jgi:peptidoglycan biosynthesis protein MviN/MurJ (putative lipid II flippase)
VFRGVQEKLSWRAVIYGWIVAIVTGVVLNVLFETAHVFLFGGQVLNPDNLTTALITLSLLSGFLSHFIGGYVAGRKAQVYGGLQGAMVAILGFLFVVVAAVAISAIVVATAGLFLVEGGLALPSMTLGLAGGALLASLVLLALNLLGGYFGGKMGEWERGPVATSVGARPRSGRRGG